MYCPILEQKNYFIIDFFQYGTNAFSLCSLHLAKDLTSVAIDNVLITSTLSSDQV